MLYELHDNPSSLVHHDKLKTHHPDGVWRELDRQCRAKKLSEKEEIKLFKAYEHLWAKNASYAANYASMIGKPFPAGEPAIAKSAFLSYEYAYEVLQKRFPLGEPAIAMDGKIASEYASDVLKKAFPLGEPEIAKDAENSYFYAYNALGKRFPAGEPVMSKDMNIAFEYAVRVLKKPFPLGEPAIAKDHRFSKAYLGHFPQRTKVMQELQKTSV